MRRVKKVIRLELYRRGYMFNACMWDLASTISVYQPDPSLWAIYWFFLKWYTQGMIPYLIPQSEVYACDTWDLKAYLSLFLRSSFTGTSFKLGPEDFFLYWLSLYVGHKPWPVDFYLHTCFVYYVGNFSYFCLDSPIFKCFIFPFFNATY